MHDCYTDYFIKLKIDIYKFFISLIKGKILRNEIKKFDKIKKAKMLFLYNLKKKKYKNIVIINKNNKQKKKPNSISDIIGFKFINC